MFIKNRLQKINNFTFTTLAILGSIGYTGAYEMDLLDGLHFTLRVTILLGSCLGLWLFISAVNVFLTDRYYKDKNN